MKTLIPGKAFIVQTSDLEGRWDASFYEKNIFYFLKTTPHKVISIGRVLKSIKSGFGAGKQDQESGEDGILQIRPTNMDESGLLKFNRNVYVPPISVNEQKDAFLETGDIIFNNTNSQELVGKTAYYEMNEIMTFSNHITRIRVDGSIIKSKFLWILLNTYQHKKIFYNICTNWNNQSGIGIDRLRSLKIPIPPMAIQQQIIALMEDAYAAKRAKEAEAAALLASIDPYLMEQLGVTLMEGEQQKIFTVSTSQVGGGRLDPLYHSKFSTGFIQNSIYPVTQLKNAILYATTGFAAGKQDQSEEAEIVQIRPTNMNENRELVFERNVYIKAEEVNNRKSDILIKGEVLFNNTNSQELVGKTTYFDIDGVFVCSNHITRVRAKEDLLSPIFLSYILNFYQKNKVFFTICTNWNNQSGVNAELLKTIPIPLPPLEVQHDIVTHISDLRARAAALKAEARETLATAKHIVERMILGEP